MVYSIFNLEAQTLVFEGILAVKQYCTVHTAGTIERRRSTLQQFHAFNIQFSQTDYATYRKVKARSLVIHSVDQLVEADVTTTVKTAGTHTAEGKAGNYYVNAFKIG